MVTLLRGSRLWTGRSDFPSFLRMQNHHERYEELDGSYTPASNLVQIILHTSLKSPGGIGIFFSTQGICSTTGKSIGGKKSVRKLTRSVSYHVNPSFCLHMKSWSRSRSFCQRKSVSWILSSFSFRSSV